MKVGTIFSSITKWVSNHCIIYDGLFVFYISSDEMQYFAPKVSSLGVSILSDVLVNLVL